MGQVKIELNGKIYRLLCGDGEEGRLRELAGYVGSRIQGLAEQTGQHGDDRLLVMAALLLADELLEFKAGVSAGAAQGDDADEPDAPMVPSRLERRSAPVVEQASGDTGCAPGSQLKSPPPLPVLVHDATKSAARTQTSEPDSAGEDAAGGDGDSMTIRKLRTLTPAAKSLEDRLAEARSGRHAPDDARDSDADS